MNDPDTVRLTFTCPRCGSVNELTATHLHEGTLIHCSHCSAAIAPLGVLRHQYEHEIPPDLRQAG